MPSKNTSVISARVKDETAVKLGVLAEDRGITIAKMLDIMVSEFERQGKKGVTPDEYYVSAVSDEEFQENLRYKELRLDRLVSAFEKRNYPDNAIRQCIEQIIYQVLDGGNFNPRRKYDSDCGC